MDDSLRRMKQEYRKNLYTVYGLVALLLLGLVFAILKNMPASLTMIVLALLYQLIFLRWRNRQYEKKMNAENLGQTVCKELKDAVLDEKGGAGLTGEMIAEAKLLPHFVNGQSPFSAFLGVAGTLPSDKNVRIIAADTALNDTYHDAKGNRKGLANVGCWIHASFPEKKPYDLRAMGDGPLLINMEEDFQAACPEMARISSGKLLLPDTLHVYAPEGTDIPGDEFFRKLKNLVSFTSGEVWVSLRDDHADFFLRNRFLAAPVQGKTEPTREMLALDPLPEMKRVIEILKEI